MNDCDSTEPTYNVKCIVLTLFLSAGYWFLPYRNPYVLLCILYFTYVALAWYDYLYDCKRNMGPTYLAHFYWFLKPPESSQVKAFKNWCPSIYKKVLIVDIVIAFFAFIALVVFIRFKRKNY